MEERGEVAAALARNIRAHRTRRHWTLDTLASRSGVSKGMLVQIEQARTNPSIATLLRIANALAVPLPRLVEVAEAPTVRIVRADRVVRLWSGPSGGQAHLLVGSEGPEQVELWDWHMEPGESYQSDGHPPGTREMVFAIEGAQTLELDGGRYVIQPGDAAIYRADRPHRYANEGPGLVRFVMVVIETPPEAEESDNP